VYNSLRGSDANYLFRYYGRPRATKCPPSAAPPMSSLMELARTAAIDFARSRGRPLIGRRHSDVLCSALTSIAAGGPCPGSTVVYSDRDIALVTAAGLSHMHTMLCEARLRAVFNWGSQGFGVLDQSSLFSRSMSALDRIDYLDPRSC